MYDNINCAKNETYKYIVLAIFNSDKNNKNKDNNSNLV
jgi:hypothetical protein